VRNMKVPNHQIKIALLVAITILLSCGRKELSDASAFQDVPQSQREKDESSVIETIPNKNPQSTIVVEPASAEPEEVSAKPQEEETAITYPKTENIKVYEPLSKEDAWFLVGGVTGDRAYKVFVDPRTIVGKNDLVESWSKLEFEEAQSDEDGLSYKQVQINSSIDCKNRTYSYTDSKFYDGLGRMVESQPAPYEPQPIIEGTVSAKIADFVCGYETNKPE